MRTAAIMISLVATSGATDMVLMLPTWSEESREVVASDEWLPGGELLTGEAEEPTNDETELKPPTPAEMTEQLPANEIPEEYLDAYFAHRPESFLIDPQNLLSPSAQRDRQTFLKYHSTDSKVDFHVYVFGTEQEIPGEVRDEEISERLFDEGRPSLTLFYYLGAPERSEIFLSPALTDAVSDAERRRILQSSILAAAEKPDSIAQLEAFCVQTSIRIYWIEKAVGLVDEELPTSLAKSNQIEVPEAPSRVDALKAMFHEFWGKWGSIVSLSVSGLSVALFGLWITGRRKKHRFPEFEVAPRLGGAHAAGVGAVIAFGSTTQSPSTQRSDVPDYFGGI